jgi:hypothetical protein
MKRVVELWRLLLGGKRSRRFLVVLGATGLMFGALPQLAWAGPTLTVFAGNTTGAPAANGDVTSSAHCSNTSTDVVTGGGITITTSPDGVMAGNAQRLEGTEPSPDGTNASTNNTYNAPYWLGVDGAGGMMDSSGSATAYAVCDASATWTGGTTITTTILQDPTTSMSAVPATATCPTGTTVVGGGGYVNPPNGAFKVIASYPSDTLGNPAADRATNPNNPKGWTAIGWVGGSGGNSSDWEEAWAVCAKNSVTITVMQNWASGPGAASTTTPVTTGKCDNYLTGSTIASGGYSVDHKAALYGGSTGFVESLNTGDHAVGSFPSDVNRNPATGSGVQYWTADGHSGGSTSGGSTTHVWGLCAS